MSIVKIIKDRYSVDPVYQWSRNQDLVIYGLSLSSIPEIHFANSRMKNAIVKQSKVDESGVITVQIPNTLLEVASPIDVYICTYEGDSFQTLYKITVPIKAKQKPDDYITVDEEEIYSYNALENMVINALDKLTTDYTEAIDKLTNASEDMKTTTEELTNAKNVITEKLKKVDEAIEITEKNANETESYSLNPPKISDDGYWMIWDVETSIYNKTNYKAIGEDGLDGRNGLDGVSPTVEITKNDGVTTITITDATGTHMTTINDGQGGSVENLANVATSGKASDVSIIPIGDSDATNVETFLQWLYSNFSTATKNLGNILVAEGLDVPDGSSLNDLINLIPDNLAKVVTTGFYEISDTTNSYSVNKSSASSKINFNTIVTDCDVFSLDSGIITTIKAGVGLELVIDYTYSAEYGNVTYAWNFLVYKNGILVGTYGNSVSSKTSQSASTNLGTFTSLSSGDTIYVMIQGTSTSHNGGNPVLRNLHLKCTIKDI